MRGACGVPSDAQAVMMQVAVTGSDWQGHLNVHLPGTDPGATSVVNFAAGETIASNGHFLLNPQGELAIADNQQAGTTHLIVDVTGYFR
jgi:hypothetical protein